MSDALLPYYQRELAALRRLGADFAAAHPKIAARLRLTGDVVDDPHVERLLEGAAFLSARVQHRLDDEFPELTDTLLSVLYPHYLAPVPSAAVARFACQPDLSGPARIPPGLALESEPVRSEVCSFRTAAPLTLWPIEVEAVRLSGLPVTAPANPLAQGANAVLRIALRCVVPDMTFAQLAVDRLRFFLRGAASTTCALYELLCAHAVSVAYADGIADPAPVIVPKSVIVPAGFAPDEALLPWPARSFAGFRWLTEFFTLPEKFLFLDFMGMEAKTLASGKNRLEIFVYLDRALTDLERTVSADSLRLGCAPIVNLFSQHCEPIALTHTETEYRIVPDVRRPGALEVWSVEAVRETIGDGRARRWQPFYRLGQHGGAADEPEAFYHVARRDSPPPLGGTECYLAPHDPLFDANRPDLSVISVDALCLNRDLPSDLPFGGGHPTLALTDPTPVVAAVECLTAPTTTLRAPRRERHFWRLVSHLSLGHLSVVGEEEGAAALREVLRLYDLRETAETRAAIGALLAVSARPGAARIPGGRAGGFCRGLDVTLQFDARAWQVGGLYLFASVVDRFLALHATVNAFVRTTVTLRGRPGQAARWPARAGMRVLL